MPTTYYGPESGFGQLMLYHPKRNPISPMRIGVVGMGAGTLAAYGVAGDYFRFYELNPGVDQLVRGKNAWFSYVNDSRAEVDVVLGDGRISLERELQARRPQNFDVLVLDAFNGDAVPVHLLTEEAIQTYLSHLAADGVLAVHVSSTTVDLSPVLLAAKERMQLAGIVTELSDSRSNVSSIWILLARNPEALRTAGLSRCGRPLEMGRKPVSWTDDYTNIAALPYR
jgi:spermidine synthase